MKKAGKNTTSKTHTSSEISAKPSTSSNTSSEISAKPSRSSPRLSNKKKALSAGKSSLPSRTETESPLLAESTERTSDVNKTTHIDPSKTVFDKKRSENVQPPDLTSGPNVSVQEKASTCPSIYARPGFSSDQLTNGKPVLRESNRAPPNLTYTGRERQMLADTLKAASEQLMRMGQVNASKQTEYQTSTRQSAEQSRVTINIEHLTAESILACTLKWAPSWLDEYDRCNVGKYKIITYIFG